MFVHVSFNEDRRVSEFLEIPGNALGKGKLCSQMAFLLLEGKISVKSFPDIIVCSRWR